VIGRKVVIAGLAGLLAGASAVAVATGQFGADPDRQRIEKIVREYVLRHPEIIPEAMQLLQDREAGKLVEANRAAFETPFGSAWAGAADGDVVLVEFFDYACGFCRKSNADIERLLREDKRLKVVWRELPVLGDPSVAAAHASLSAASQGKFRPFYDRLFEAGRPTPETIAAAQRAAGIRAGATTPAMQAEIEKNYQLAQAIRASGTPTFVVGNRVLQGAVGYEALKQAVADARKGG